jgi:AraC-like DNA-binding protein
MRKAPELLPASPAIQRTVVRKVHDPGVDVLTDVLASLGLVGRLFCRSVLSAPWGLSFPSGSFGYFHVVERGSAWLGGLPGRAKPIALSLGDFVVLPQGTGHSLADVPGRRIVPIRDLVQETQSERGVLLVHGGGGPETSLLCGAFGFRRWNGHPLVSLLPSVIHMRSGAAGRSEWLDPTLQLLGSESLCTRPGHDTVVTRLIDVLFIQVLRAWLEEGAPRHGHGWLGGLRDSRIARALAAMHEKPGRAWTVRDLASRAGMSRSPFAAHFSSLVGEPPLSYLTRWRMQVAATLFQDDPELTIGHVASHVGYESEPAFNKAFKRATGITPGAFRRQKGSVT